MSAIVRLEDVSKRFRLSQTKSVKERLLGVSGHRPRSQVVEAVHHLNLEIAEGESIALLGHNGSGKSTTLKMLAGTVAPTSGQIWARGRIAPLLELGAGFHPDLTGRENIFINAAILGIPRRRTQDLLDEIVDFAEIGEFIDTPVKFYSSGMSVRLGFAIAVNVDPDILLVDELLAVGDSDFQERCLARMVEYKASGRTFILVTHSLDQAMEFCDRAVVLNHGRVAYDGGAAQAADAYHASRRSSLAQTSQALVASQVE